MNNFKWTFVLAGMIFAFQARAQMKTVKTACQDYHMSCSKAKGKKFRVSNQSRSGAFALGNTSELVMVAYKGMDYHIAVCAERKLGAKVQFQIIDPKTEDILYDNIDDNYAEVFEFTCKSTKRLTIAVTVPDSGSGDSGSKKEQELACVGLLVEHAKGTSIGFGK